MNRFRSIALLGALLWMIFGAQPSIAQTSPNWTYGYVPTVAQWNAIFASKQDYLGAPPLLKTGGTMTGLLTTATPSTALAGFNLPPGTAPSAPNNGDLWSTSSGLYIRINGATVGPLTGGSGGSFTATSPLAVSFPAGVVNYSIGSTIGVPLGGTGTTSFTASLPILGNGTSGLTQGTRSGNTTAYVTTSGALTPGDCLVLDASLNAVDNGSGCGANSNTPHTQDFLSGTDFTPGTTTSLTLSSAPTSTDLLNIYFDGIAQAINTWSLVGAVVTFNAAIPLNTQVVEAKWSTSSTLAGVGSINGLHGALTLAAGSGISVTPSGGNTLTVATSYTQPGTGAVARSIPSKLSEYMSILDYGAACNGVTADDTAVGFADVAAAALGRALHWNCLSTAIAGTLSPVVGAHWIGDNVNLTSIYLLSTTATAYALSNSGIELEHFRVLPSTTRTFSAVTFAISNTFNIHDVSTIFNGISFSFSGSPTGILNNVQTIATVANGVDIDMSAGTIVSINNSVFSGNPSTRAFAHFVLRNIPGQLQIINTNAFQANTCMTIIPGSGQVVTLVKGSTSYLDSCPSGMITAAPTGTGIFQRFSWVDGWLSGSTTANVVLTGGGSTTCDEIDFHNNEIIGGTSAVGGISSTNCTRLNVSHNRIFNFSNYGINVASTIGCEIGGNQFIPTIGTGILMSGSTDDCVIHDNNLVGAGSPSISTTSTGTHNNIHDNTGYNPVGAATVSSPSSGGTYTAGASRETLYCSASTSITAATQGGVSVLPAATGANVNLTFDLGPNEALVPTYTGTLTCKKMVH